MESNLPLISVGIPTYCRPEGLRLTLERVTAQTYKNLEIIISDNCSPDHAAIQTVIDHFAKNDPRIKFHRQSENIGTVRNFHFLLKNATGKYFCWAADDDEIEVTYVEELKQALESRPGVALSMSSYIQHDTMSQPEIHKDLSSYLAAIADPDLFTRLKKYLDQPDHMGKSRLVWGMFLTSQMQRAFEDCLAQRMNPSEPAIWGDLPIELRMLSYGDLVMVPNVLFHVHLLPSSTGRKGLGLGKTLVHILEKTSHAYRQVVLGSALGESEKKKLLSIIRRRELSNQAQVLVYYQIQRYLPGPARWIKKLWYLFS